MPESIGRARGSWGQGGASNKTTYSAHSLGRMFPEHLKGLGKGRGATLLEVVLAAKRGWKIVFYHSFLSWGTIETWNTHGKDSRNRLQFLFSNGATSWLKGESVTDWH